MAIYPSRVWNEFSGHVYVLDEGAWVDIEEMDEGEFRRFLLWRLGLAFPKKTRYLTRALESAPAPARPMRLKYDVRRVQRASKR